MFILRAHFDCALDENIAYLNTRFRETGYKVDVFYGPVIHFDPLNHRVKFNNIKNNREVEALAMFTMSANYMYFNYMFKKNTESC